MRKSDFPIPEPKKKLKTENNSRPAGVLTEEEYLSSLSEIIQRDYFPKISNENLVSDEKSKLKLEEFFSKYNSEDNESFKDILEQDKQAWIDRYWWLSYSTNVEKSRLKPLLDAEKEGKVLTYKEKPLQVTDFEEKTYFMFEPNVELRSNEPEDKAKKVIPENTRITNPEEISMKNYLTIQKEGIDDRFGTPDILGLTKKKGKIQGYSMLAIPSPSPSQLSTPLVTWGEIVGDPKLLKEDSRFSIQQKSDRESLQDQLMNSMLKRRKESQKQSEDRVKSLLSCTPGRMSSGISSSRISLGGSSVLRRIFDEKSNSGTPRTLSKQSTPGSLRQGNNNEKKEKTDGLLNLLN